MASVMLAPRAAQASMRGMAFHELTNDVLAGFFGHNPVFATEMGEHAHDRLWPDLTEAGRQARLAWLAETGARLQAVDPGSLSRDDAIDRRILLEQLEATRFSEETLREETWSPLWYVYLFGNGLFLLLARGFA